MKKFKQIVISLCLLASCIILMGAAPSIKIYSEHLDVSTDGSGKVTAKIELADIVGGTIHVPLSNWKGIQHLRWEDDGGLTVDPMLNADNPYIKVVVPPRASANIILRLSFNLAAPKPDTKNAATNERFLTYRFLNTGQLPVTRYELQTILPAGEVLHSVQETLPKSKTGDGAQIRYISDDNRQGFTLEAKNIKFGDAASVRLRVIPEKKSYIFLVLGIACAIAYLYAFRDIVGKKKQDTQQAAQGLKG